MPSICPVASRLKELRTDRSICWCFVLTARLQTHGNAVEDAIKGRETFVASRSIQHR